MIKPIAWYKPLVYGLLCTLADTVDTLVLAIYSDTTPQISLLPSETDELSDEAILESFEGGVSIGPTAYSTSPHTVMKWSQDVDEYAPDASEANALKLLFEKTTIPVPRVRRVVKHEMGNVIVMDYIKGQTLDTVWKALSLWKKIRLAFILRRYIRQLRQIVAPINVPPGPLTLDPAQPRICECPSIFGAVKSWRGPFRSYAEFSAFWNNRHKMALKNAPEDDPMRNELFDDSSPLVLSHMDLNPRNMILGEDGRLWIIDWAWAGYYPAWFEYVAMLDRVENEELLGFQDSFWELMIPFACGPFFKPEQWLYRMQFTLDYY